MALVGAQVQSPAAAAAVFDTLLHFLRVSLLTALVLGHRGDRRLSIRCGPPATSRARNTERTADSAAYRGGIHEVHARRAGSGSMLAGDGSPSVSCSFSRWCSRRATRRC